MPKAANKPARSDDQISGVRRSPSAERSQRSAAALASTVGLVLLSLWLWNRPTALDSHDSRARIVAKSLPLRAAAPGAPRIALPRPHVELEVSVWPYGARLLLDGAPLPGNPFSGSFPRDGRLHSLRAEGRGLQHQELGITFDRDRSLRLTLSSVAGSRGATRAGRRARAEAAASSHRVWSSHAPADDAPLAPPRRAHEIYEEDPYR